VISENGSRPDTENTERGAVGFRANPRNPPAAAKGATMRRISIVLALFAVLGILMAPPGCQKQASQTKPADQSKSVEDRVVDVDKPSVEDETAPLLETGPGDNELQPENTVDETLPDITPGPTEEP
jgi:hypothetical protein